MVDEDIKLQENRNSNNNNNNGKNNKPFSQSNLTHIERKRDCVFNESYLMKKIIHILSKRFDPRKWYPMDFVSNLFVL